MLKTPEGISIVVNFEHPLNASLAILVTAVFLSNVTLTRLEQFVKSLLVIATTPLGMVILFKFVQPLKALAPIDVSLDESGSSTSEEQPWKALAP